MPKVDLEKATKKDLITYIRNKKKGEKGLTVLKKEELVRFAKKVKNQHKKKMMGGDFAPVSDSKCEDAYNGFASVDAAFNNLTFKGGKKSSKKTPKRKTPKRKTPKRKTMRGGQESSGQTFFPPRYYNPDAPLPDPKTDMQTAYGMANPVSGACRNLAPFPNSSGQQTGGKKKTPKRKMTKKRTPKRRG